MPAYKLSGVEVRACRVLISAATHEECQPRERVTLDFNVDDDGIRAATISALKKKGVILNWENYGDDPGRDFWVEFVPAVVAQYAGGNCHAA